MRNLKWQKDKMGDLIAYAFKNNIRISLRVKKDNTYEGWLLQGSTFLTANNNVKIFTGKEDNSTKAIIAATKSLFNYMGGTISDEKEIKEKNNKEEDNLELSPRVVAKHQIAIEKAQKEKEVILQEKAKEEVEIATKLDPTTSPIKIFTHKNSNNTVELITNQPVDEIRYIRGKRSITSKKVKAKIYKEPITLEKGVTFTASAFVGEEVVATAIFGDN